MKVSDFNYDLPKELIAQVPIPNRDQSRLMVLDRKCKSIDHKIFKDIIDYLEPGDCLVRNNTKVIPARLYGVKEETGAHVEFLLLHRIEDDIWEVMVKPGRKLMPGTKVVFGEGLLEKSDTPRVLLKAEILEQLEGGSRKVKFEYEGIFNEILNEIGLMPLPPYIHEKLKEKDRYQTVYAKYEGSAAAPTAGLHFTQELLEQIKAKGVEIANVTLHVGIGTFRPVKVENVEEHDMHSEHFYIKQEDAEKINKAKREGHRVIAVGTTSCRVLESIADENGMVKETENDTNIFIYPGYQFKCLDCLITNFHLPESTLIMLVSALAGKDFVMKAYEEAVKEEYRFFSFGDAMFIR
ncbi:MAG: tRNA preQ1(34) S-adenosylmethionine ribosyltransferase-isomerase QueA [Clostridia bacterium]|nr:tRNA preQ1(34) S-adenosylmethionine ribosyltransferase-isomerase QueA [Clostridia bacterium]